jgi:hypothetical protein
MRKAIRWIAATFVVLLVGTQFIRPARTNPIHDPARTLFAVRPVPSHVVQIFERACRDCHSNETRWPWYSNLAPVSWFVIDHVNHGRSHFNYSEWDRYQPEEAARLLKNACDLAREREMPLTSYTWMHGNARLSRADVDAICGWTNADGGTR